MFSSKRRNPLSASSIAAAAQAAYQGSSKYFTTDVRVRYQVNKQVSAAFGIDNLNNYPYWSFHPYPQRTFMAELKYDL